MDYGTLKRAKNVAEQETRCIHRASILFVFSLLEKHYYSPDYLPRLIEKACCVGCAGEDILGATNLLVGSTYRVVPWSRLGRWLSGRNMQPSTPVQHQSMLS